MRRVRHLRNTRGLVRPLGPRTRDERCGGHRGHGRRTRAARVHKRRAGSQASVPGSIVRLPRHASTWGLAGSPGLRHLHSFVSGGCDRIVSSPLLQHLSRGYRTGTEGRRAGQRVQMWSRWVVAEEGAGREGRSQCFAVVFGGSHPTALPVGVRRRGAGATARHRDVGSDGCLVLHSPVLGQTTMKRSITVVPAWTDNRGSGSTL